MDDFKVLQQSNYLMKVTSIPKDMAVGDVYESENGKMFQVVYIGREDNELGLVPVTLKEEK